MTITHSDNPLRQGREQAKLTERRSSRAVSISDSQITIPPHIGILVYSTDPTLHGEYMHQARFSLRFFLSFFPLFFEIKNFIVLGFLIRARSCLADERDISNSEFILLVVYIPPSLAFGRQPHLMNELRYNPGNKTLKIDAFLFCAVLVGFLSVILLTCPIPLSI